MDTPDGIE